MSNLDLRSVATSDHARRASLVGAIVAAIAASACCLVPAVLAVVGLSGVGFAVALEPYRPLFLGAAGVALAAGFYFTYRGPRVTEGIACECERPRPRATRAARLVLWASTIGVLVLAGYPYLAAIGTRDTATGSSAPVASSVTRGIRIDGMTCEGCTEQIVDALVEVEGVNESHVDFRAGRASVTYDPRLATIEQLVAAIERLGYAASVEPLAFPAIGPNWNVDHSSME